MKNNNYILVDTENVGYKLPYAIYPNTKIIYFVKNKLIKNTYKEKLKELYIFDKVFPNLIKFINIERYEHKNNCMDICIMKYVLKLVLKENDSNIIIISKDNDYEDFIKHTLKLSKGFNISIRRANSLNIFNESIINICDDNTTISKENANFPSLTQGKPNVLESKEVKKSFSNYSVPSDILELVKTCSSTKQLNKKLTSSQKSSLQFDKYQNKIANVSCHIEYDFYEKKYHVVKSGAILFKSKDFGECKSVLKTTIKNIEREFAPFKTAENYKKIRKLKAHKIVRKAALENKLNKSYLKQNINNNDIYKQVVSIVL